MAKRHVSEREAIAESCLGKGYDREKVVLVGGTAAKAARVEEAIVKPWCGEEAMAERVFGQARG